MNERTIWIVRIIGVAVILLLFVLLMSLHSRLVRLNEERQQPKGGSGAVQLPSPGSAGGERAHA